MDNFLTDIHNISIKTDNYVQNNLTGLARSRVQVILNGSTSELDTYSYIRHFTHLSVIEQAVTSATLTDKDISIMLNGFLNYQDTANNSNTTLIIHSDTDQWSYILYVVVILTIYPVIHLSVNYTMIALNLRSILSDNDSLKPIENDTLNRIARIITNHSILSIVSDQYEYEYQDQYHDEFEKHSLALALVFNDIVTDNDDVVIRPPIEPFMDRLIDDTLEKLDPGIQMDDTSGEKPSDFPDSSECLNITSYAGYEPTPDSDDETNTSIKSKKELKNKMLKLEKLMINKIYNKGYAKDMLHSGMSVREVYDLLNLVV
jgi:hypothetical protein